MTSHKTTRPTAEALSTLESLILAQAVYEFGSKDWERISSILSKHPLLHRSKAYFTQDVSISCHELFLALMKAAELEPPEPEHSRKAPTVLKLAQIHYVARVREIQDLLKDEETKFKRIVAEIDLIRSGKWDDKIRADLLGVPHPPEPETTATPATEEQPSAPEPQPPAVTATDTVDAPQRSSQDTNEVADVAEETSELPPTTEPPVDSSEPAVETELAEPVPQAQVEPSPKTPMEPPQASEEAQSPDVEIVEDVPSSRDSSAKPMEGVEEAAVEEIVDDEPAAAAVQMEVDVEEEAPEVKTEKPEEPTVSPEPRKPTPATDVDVDMTATPRATPSQDGKRKTSEALSEPPRERKRLREDSEPVDEESEQGPSTTKGRRKFQGGDKKFQNVIGMLHSTISQHRYGNIFHNPIKKSEAADYSDLVKRPMDLKTIKARVKEGVTTNSLEFQRDVYLMFANAMMYNRPGSEIYAMAEEMMLESEIQINNFRQTEGFHHK